MFRLILLLLGNEFARRRLPLLVAIGIAWALLGVALFIDALDGVPYLPMHAFGYLLIVDGAVTLIAAPFGNDTRAILRKARGALFLILGLLVADGHHGVLVALAMVFGLAFLVDGAFRIVAAWIVRFAGWRLSLLTGLAEVGFAVFLFEPYPTFYAGTVPYCIGAAMFFSGLGLARQALRLRRIPPGAAVSLWLSRDIAPTLATQATEEPEGVTPASGDLVVHVWTPRGSADSEGASRPVVDRYIAAVDGNGVISTGHAAMEAQPGIYISHYPKVEIDRSQTDFTRALRATADNNVEGRFLPSYAEEAAGWCDSTVQVRFAAYNRARLTHFWQHYRANNTYNLTNRNCSSTVAHALEAALEGTLAPRAGARAMLRTMLNPELWVAARLYRHAQTMAWTPGLVLDYARTLKAALDPSPFGWHALWQFAARSWRQLSHRRLGPAAGDAVAARKAAKVRSPAAAPTTRPPSDE